MNKEQLKIQALREKIGELVVQYEDRIADLRVELTMAAQSLEEAQREIGRLKADIETSGVGEVVPGEVMNVLEEED